jgi:LL-diaminopimelate aminotransferase
MAINGGKRVGVVVYSFAYHFGLPPLPFGFVVGNREVISGLVQAAQLVPIFIPEYYVDLALTAIRRFPNDALKQVRALITRNAAEGVKLTSLLGLEKSGYDAVPFLWAKIERRRQATAAAELLYRRYHLLTVPGTAFGDAGEGFLRLSLTAPTETYATALKRVNRRLKLAKLVKDR